MTGNNSAVAVNAITRDELDTPVTWEEAVSFHGITDADVFVASIYTVINQDKSALIAEPFIIRKITVKTDDNAKREYVIVHLVTKNEVKGTHHFVMTDGSTGICAQLLKLIDDRIADEHPTPYEGIIVANGLRVSEYIHEESGQEAATYYLA